MCYQKAAELGHTVSMFRMGDAYQYGLRGNFSLILFEVRGVGLVGIAI